MNSANRTFRVLGLVGLVALIIVASQGFGIYKAIYQENIVASADGNHLFTIPSGSSFEELVDNLKTQNVILDVASFRQVAGLMKFSSVKPGLYEIDSGMNNRKLISLLRRGEQKPIKIRVRSSRHIDKVVGNLCKNLEADSSVFINMLKSDTVLHSLGFNQENIISLFVPDTYEFYWSTNEKKLLDRMKSEYNKYWNDDRRAQAAVSGLTPQEAMKLASIINEETAKESEMSRIAGVYINRLKRGMKLQADPTVKFAVGDWSLKRVRDKHVAVKSPYNTYQVTGLPPGPIRLPTKQAIEAVLNAEEHRYLYFCAKEDFSGFHNFSRTLTEHNNHANRYRSELNKRRIQ